MKQKECMKRMKSFVIMFTEKPGREITLLKNFLVWLMCIITWIV